MISRCESARWRENRGAGDGPCDTRSPAGHLFLGRSRGVVMKERDALMLVDDLHLVLGLSADWGTWVHQAKMLSMIMMAVAIES